MKSFRRVVKKKGNKTPIPLHVITHESPSDQRRKSPPMDVDNALVAKTWLFQRQYIVNAGLETYNISPAKLGFLFAIVTATNATITGLFEYFTVKQIEMWATPPSDGSVVDISLGFNGNTLGQLGDDKFVRDQTSGTNRNAYIKKKLKGSDMQAAQAQNTNSTFSTTLFTLNIAGTNSAAANSVTSVITIALRGVGKLSNDIRTSLNTTTIAVGGLSDICYSALDNSGGASLSSSSLLLPPLTLHSLK